MLRSAPALRFPCCAWAPARAHLAWAFAGTIPSAAHSLLRLGTGLSLSSLSLSCFARKTRACRPWHARSPGKGSTGPFAVLRFTRGLGVRRDDPCALHSLLRLGTGPSLSWLGRSPGQQSTGLLSFSGAPTGHSSYSGSPTGLLSFSGAPTGHSPYSGYHLFSEFYLLLIAECLYLISGEPHVIKTR